MNLNRRGLLLIVTLVATAVVNAIIWSGAGCANKSGGDTKRSTLEAMASRLCVSSEENDMGLEFYECRATSQADPLAALGWIAYSRLSGSGEAWMAFDRNKETLLGKVQGAYPLDVIGSATDAIRDLAEEPILRLADGLNPQMAAVVPVESLGWYLASAVRGDNWANAATWACYETHRK